MTLITNARRKLPELPVGRYGRVHESRGEGLTLWFAALLGLVQGLTEFLPVSSTAHLRITPALLGQPDPGASFSAVIQLGTLLAVIVYFAKDLFVKMPRAFFTDRSSPEGRLPVYLVLGTIPIVILGLSLRGLITGPARSLWVVASALAFLAVVMVIAEKRSNLTRTLASIRLSDAMIIGFAQALALVPGMSRSGSTIVFALFLGFRRDDAARFSFLLGIPAIAGAGIFEFKDALAELGTGSLGPLLVGTAVAFISGYASIAWLLRFLGSRTLLSFAGYRLILAGVIFALSFAGLLNPYL